VLRRLGTALVAALVLVASSTDAGLLPIAPLPSPDEVYPTPPDWRGVRVLHVGDSNVAAGLVAGLRKAFTDAGAVYQPHGWVGSRSKSWVVSGLLAKLVREVAPQVVVVTLETNTLRSRRIDVNAAWVRRFVERIGPRRCYWLGPPPLIEDAYGYGPVLADACAPCRYFDTSRLPYPKREDGRFHLTRQHGLDWADRAWAWMNGRADEIHAL
jgi:hypothetical protein